MLIIKLNKTEYAYIVNFPFSTSELKSLLSSVKEQENMYVLSISENQADELRDLCGERLQIAGFDEKYELTQEGKILESLIDKFYV